MKKKDIILIMIISFIIIICLGINKYISYKKGEFIEIYVNNKLYKQVSIDSKEEFTIETKNGYNVVKIHDKGVEIAKASCPDKVCVHAGIIHKPNQSIVCIPNKVNIKIITNEKNKPKEDIIVK
ncbi:NusG domain II-containing protein [Romboutsia maritimum]|uniref:NusG domain II-containing protein n=1 Tax=Romboutsia maritimum TaxID=2020948 RepID=A0A371IU31_9FIRM|nr:NusG domain II-containing protein [Romboutsia maritimum]RDY23997.1 NusG domain II-containing protein [Romboutsia maritimum]